MKASIKVRMICVNYWKNVFLLPIAHLDFSRELQAKCIATARNRQVFTQYTCCVTSVKQGLGCQFVYVFTCLRLRFLGGSFQLAFVLSKLNNFRDFDAWRLQFKTRDSFWSKFKALLAPSSESSATIRAASSLITNSSVTAWNFHVTLINICSWVD